MTPKHLAKFVGQDVLIHWQDVNDDWPTFRVLAVDGDEIWLRGINTPEGYQHDGSSVVVQCAEVERIKRLSRSDGGIRE